MALGNEISLKRELSARSSQRSIVEWCLPYSPLARRPVKLQIGFV